MRKLLMISVLGLALLAPASGSSRPMSKPGGCAVLVPDMQASGSSNCRYVATGPGEYKVVSGISGWRIVALRNGKTWITLAWQHPIYDERQTPGLPGVHAPASGTIASLPGDLVDVSMNLSRACVASMCQTARAGYMEVGDIPPS